MSLTAEEKQGLSVALNEATLLGMEVDRDRKLAAATFRVLTLPKQGPPPIDPRVQLIFSPVGRVAASLRLGRWNDLKAQVLTFDIDELLSVVQSFGGLPIYGWKFFDTNDEGFARWSDRLSLDYRSDVQSSAHSILLFQDGGDRYLEICLWFDQLQIKDPKGNDIPIADFIGGGRRWWDALYQGDERTSGSGIVPLKSE